ncbi:hypothetical protein [Saccharopolyspora sp. CA-218241]|uniref:hypothetical protein n=1 Tax=Saccharopolyspora sp. CA-218241 TaxID=3240027 RepID=UPI003D99ED7A
MIEVLALRHSWAQPGEPLAWVIAASGQYLFEVSGRDGAGNPQHGMAARLARGAGRAVGGALVEAADAVSGDSGPAYRNAPAGVVTGAGPECTAAALVDAHRERGGRAVWVLTDRRLALVGVCERAPAEDRGGSLLDRARRAGAGLLGGSAPEDGPGSAERGAPGPALEPWVERPRSAIAGFEPGRRALGRQYGGGRTCFLVTRFTDGSALELAPSAAESDVHRLVAMSRGQA